MKEAIELLQETMAETEGITKEKVEAQMIASKHCKRAQQKFLDPHSQEDTIKRATKGVGGNTTNQRCFIVEQASVNAEHVKKIQQGLY